MPARAVPSQRQQHQQVNAAVAARKYVGVQDYSWNAPADRQNGFWDPNIGGTDNTYGFRQLPQYPNLMDAAQKDEGAQGINVPWYITRGNHDTLIQGNVPTSKRLERQRYPAAPVDHRHRLRQAVAEHRCRPGELRRAGR